MSMGMTQGQAREKGKEKRENEDQAKGGLE